MLCSILVPFLPAALVATVHCIFVVQEYAAATAEAEMAEAKSVRQGEESEAFRRIADEKRLLAYQLADLWTGLSSSSILNRTCLTHAGTHAPKPFVT